MHPEADAFLDAIFDSPDDDTPRLVYADWLTEHGQESYAQFIRLQCAAARHPLWSAEANRLWEEIGRVWNRLGDEWWPATSDWRWLDAATFHRGLLRCDVILKAGELTRYANCWAWLPTETTLLDVDPECDDLSGLAMLPLLRRIRSVCCDWRRSPYDPPGEHSGLAELLRSPHLCAVRSLDLSLHRLTQSDLDALLTAPNLATVTDLKATFDAQDWDVPVAGCVPDRFEAVQKLQSRFPGVQCEFK